MRVNEIPISPWWNRGFLGYVAYCVQKLLSRKSGHGTRLLVEVDLLTKE